VRRVRIPKWCAHTQVVCAYHIAYRTMRQDTCIASCLLLHHTLVVMYRLLSIVASHTIGVYCCITRYSSRNIRQYTPRHTHHTIHLRRYTSDDTHQTIHTRQTLGVNRWHSTSIQSPTRCLRSYLTGCKLATTPHTHPCV